jgi:hypothetical protein
MSFATPLHVALEDAGLMLAMALPPPALRPRAPDPYAISLPPVQTLQPASEVLVAVAATYLYAELDLAGLVPAAEALVEARADLRIESSQVAEALERFAIDAHEFPKRVDREKLYGRLFGLGAQSSLDQSGYHAFATDFGAVCTEIVRISEMPLTSGTLGFATDRLLAGLAAHAGGDVPYRARRLHTLFARAMMLLDMPGLGQFLGTHGVMAAVRAIIADGAPDLAAAERRGRAGQKILAACGRINNPPDTDIVHAAASWLAETGALRQDPGAIA